MNRFELFLDEENDPLEILAKSQQEKRKGAVSSTSPRFLNRFNLKLNLVTLVRLVLCS